MDANELYEKYVNIPMSAQVLKKEVLNFINTIDQIMREMPDVFGKTELEDLVLIQEFFTQLNCTDVMDLFIQQVLPHSKPIKNREKEYFTRNVSLFSSFENSKVAFFYDILANDKLDKQDMIIIWDYWNIFIDLIEKYKKLK